MKGWHSRLAALRDVLDRFAVLIALVVLLLLWELAVVLDQEALSARSLEELLSVALARFPAEEASITPGG